MSISPSTGPVFVVGFPRSGTTLMRTMLSAHPDIAIAPETHFLNRFVGKSGPHDLETADRFLEFWNRFSQADRFVDMGVAADAIRDRILASGDFHVKNVFAQTLQAYAERTGKARWGEKTPAHERFVGTLLEWYSDAHVVYMVRDVRAVCASLLKAPWRINPESKPDQPKPGPLRRLRLLAEDSTFWQHSVERYERQWSAEPRVTLVHYEALVDDPEPVLRRLAESIGAGYDAQMVAGRSWESVPRPRAQWGNTEHEAWRLARIEQSLQPVNTDAVARWKRELSRLEIALIETNSRQAMASTGYQTNSGRIVRAFASLLLSALRLRTGAH